MTTTLLTLLSSLIAVCNIASFTGCDQGCASKDIAEIKAINYVCDQITIKRR